RDNLIGPEEILALVHKETASQLIDLGYFVSLFYARFDTKKRTISFVDCGSTKPLHYRAADGKAHLLKGTDFPIGMVPEDYFHTLDAPFSQGDLFVFYSDGVTEAQSPERQLFGVQRLSAIVEANTAATPTQLLRTIRHSVLSFARKEHFDDDLTIIIVKIEDSLLPKASVDKTAKFAADVSQLSAVREFVDNICMQSPGDAKIVSQQLQLAINEAFTNIAQHGYGGQGGDVILHAELTDEGILFELSDQGRPFDPANAPEPSLAGDRYCNFGLYIIKQVADVLNYVPRDDGDGWNHLRIFKRYQWEKKLVEFKHSNRDNIMIVTLEGNSLDAKEAPHFKERVTDLIGSQSISNVVFDMQHLEFIDSSGLGSLLSILRQLHSQKGDLKLAAVPPQIRTMLEIVRMHKLFEIFPSTDDAVQSFK
ncbi:MAG: anti-sigma factor antagonist, partial [Chlamydiia bacterium]|nr:anti-sigma factor antagonist [Chlamydiia bacterium]